MDPGELAGAHPELLSARFRTALQKVTGDRKLSARDFADLDKVASEPADKEYLHAIAGKALKTPDSAAFTIPVKPAGKGAPKAVAVDFSHDVTGAAAEKLVLDYHYKGRSTAEAARLLKALVKGDSGLGHVKNLIKGNGAEEAIATLLNDHIPQLTDLVKGLRKEGLTLKQVADRVNVTIDGPRILFFPIPLHADSATIADAILEHLKTRAPADRQALYDALDEKSLAWLRKAAKGELP